ncbi:Zinc finger CCCH domain-containing protein 4 [Hordeum vulgare]|nr:Zinc finger CCCH domain-containing protein 4 [Hordeum vulgare]
MASASPSWVILGRVAKVSAADADLPLGADLSLALPAPPRVALLTIPPRIFPGRTTSDNFPSVVAVDRSGLILLHASQGPAAGPAVIDLPDRKEVCWRPFVAGYFVLDSKSASAFPVPNSEHIMNPGRLGLIASPEGGGRFMLAELQPIAGSEQADLLCFSSQSGEWVRKSVPYPLPSRPLTPNGVVSHSGRLWWVDLSWGLLTCNPFADAPVLSFVPLPPRKALKYREDCAVLDKYRRVAVSRGKLRFVDLYKNRNSFGSAQISVWTLADPDSTEWTLEYEATFSEIYDDASFKATRLTRQLPVLALIHPRDPDVVYFFLDRHLFGVDVPDRKVVQCELYELVEELSSEHIATRFVHAWRLPPTLRSAADDVVEKQNAGGNREILDATPVLTCRTEVEVGGGNTSESKRRRLE